MDTTRFFRQLIAALMLLGLALTFLPGSAAAPAEPQETGSTSSEESEKTADADDTKSSADDEFIPTEEISEDFAVSFPVDI